MRKLIASMNMTLDGYCDHLAVIADEELHQYFNELLRNADTIIFGRVTYQLMEDSWPQIVKKPVGNKSIDEFAVLIDSISKVVFSNTLKGVEWRNTRLATGTIEKEVRNLKEQPGKNILVGSPSLVVELTKLGLIDEYQLCVHPVVLGSGITLFKNITERINLHLLKTKIMGSGAVVLEYEPAARNEK
ncbi:MAG: dihydrofolate reductase family protein [Bacteroidota bacterium]|nr:dihydrofolate reductase family protein [Bacteroidota bacterium]